MSDQRSLLVGYDFSDDFTQISCMNEKIKEPESVRASNQQQYLIPTALCVKHDTRDWLFGEEAIVAAANSEGTLVDHLVELAKCGESITVNEINYVASALLEKFFRKTLSILKKQYPNENIQMLVITVEETSDTLNQCIYTALDALGIQKDRVVIKNHACTAMYYALNQSKDLWMNDVGVFHYDGIHLKYYHIEINRKTKPSAVTVQIQELTDKLGKLSDYENPAEELAPIFLRLAKMTLQKSIVSTVYITGKGFDGNWVDGVLRDLCLGRRVFKGQNLYTKGGCYLAKELTGEKKLSEFILLSEDMLHTDVWVSAYVDGTIQDVVLAQVGMAWNEVNQDTEFIVDGKAEVVIHTKDLFQKDVSSFKLVLAQIPERPRKMTRVRLSLKCKNKDYLEAKLTDLGFGEMFAASGIETGSLIPLT